MQCLAEQLYALHVLLYISFHTLQIVNLEVNGINVILENPFELTTSIRSYQHVMTINYF